MLKDKTPLSFHDAARRGITRLKPVSEFYSTIDHVEIDLIHGAVGPWVRVYTQTIVAGHFDESEELLIDMLPNKESYFDDKCFVPYGGENEI